MAQPRIKLLLSIDTEEDNWRPTRDDVRVENIRALPEMHEYLVGLGLRPTYFIDYAVIRESFAADVLRAIHRDGRGEIGAHLHPWHTPPVEEPFRPENTMMKNLPPTLQRAKLRSLRTALTEEIGERPTSFRAGRFGLGRDGVQALIEDGFEVDSSVTPFVDWRESDDGSDYSSAPFDCYRLDGRGPVDRPVPDGPLCEVPLSCGFTRAPFHWRGAVHRMLSGPLPRRLRLPGLASRSGLVRRVIGSPETDSLGDLLAMARGLVASGARSIQLFFHSPSGVPGLSPFVRTPRDLETLRDTIRGFVDGVAGFATIEPATVTEAARALCGAPGERVAIGERGRGRSVSAAEVER